MADFCKQCSIEIFGEDSGDLAGIGKRQGRTLAPDMGWATMCEGCGPTIVDEEGACITVCCRKHGDDNRENRKKTKENDNAGEKPDGRPL